MPDNHSIMLIEISLAIRLSGPHGYSNAAIGLSGPAGGRGARGRPGWELGPKPTERPFTTAVWASSCPYRLTPSRRTRGTCTTSSARSAAPRPSGRLAPSAYSHHPPGQRTQKVFDMNSSFEQTIERLAIDAEIRDLAARFSDAVNRRDPDAFGDLFADDGVWEIGEPFPRRVAGRQNVITMFKNLRAPWDFFFQMTHSGVIDVAADRQTATARWEIQEMARTPDGSQSYNNVAMYYDRLVRTADSSWRFAERRYHYVWVSSADLGGRSIPRPDDLP